MNTIIAWFAGNKVAANLLMIFIVIAGFLSLQDARKEILPSISLDRITISTSYPGASPEDVEKSVINRIEAALYDLEGIETINSRATEHLGIVTLEVASGENSKDLLAEVKSRVDAIGTLPADVERPIVQEISVRNMVAYLMISGEADERSLKNIADQVKRDLLATDAITQVNVAGSRPYEIAIEVSESALQRYDVSYIEVVNAVRQSSVDLPTGVIKTAQGDVSVKAKGQVYWGEDFEDIVIRATPDGAEVLVRDVARVTDGFKEGIALSEFNGAPTVALAVYRVGDQDILDISNILHNYVEHPRSFIPDGIYLNVWQDSSIHFKSRMDLLSANALSGLLLVFVILMLFMRTKIAFWVCLGIPISFMGAFMVLPYFGGSLNMISLFAFILVLGVVVDDAIIVGENVFSQHRQGVYGVRGAIAGAQEVQSPVIFSVLTTIIAFTPLLVLPGPEGKLMSVIPIVVISTLLFSLIESLLVLPAHVSGVSGQEYDRIPAIGRLQRLTTRVLEAVINHLYTPVLNWCLHWRYTTLFAFIGIMIVALALVASGWVRVVMFSSIESDTATVSVEFAENTSTAEVRAGLKRVERAALELRDELKDSDGNQQILSVFTSFSSDTSGSVVVDLAPSESRKLSGQNVIRAWEERAGDIKNVTEMTFNATLNQSGATIDLELSSNSLDDLRLAATALKERMAEIKGLYRIRDSFQKGKQELQLALKPLASNLGLTLDDIALQVRQAYHGADVQSLQRGDQEVKVVVRYPTESRSSLWYLENMAIRLGDGSVVPLQSVASIQYGEGAAQINRNNRRRVIRVQASVDDSIVSLGTAMDKLHRDYLTHIPERFPGMTWAVSGSQKEKAEFKEFVMNAYGVAIMAMYIMMAVLFRSYWQPLMVMFAIPFGFVGALFGHFIMGIELTLWSMIGMIAVSGVVVNDNLVLVDFINRNARKGVGLLDSIRMAGVARFRPIILTSLTTFGGLLPLMFEGSLQAQFLIPMAVSIAFGVLFATSVSLVLVPALYHMLDDQRAAARRWVDWLQGKNKQHESLAYTVDHGYQHGTEDETEKLQWHMGLDEAYDAGFQAGTDRATQRVPPFTREELVASWEAGWDDGRQESEKSDK